MGELVKLNELNEMNRITVLEIRIWILESLMIEFCNRMEKNEVFLEDTYVSFCKVLGREDKVNGSL